MAGPLAAKSAESTRGLAVVPRPASASVWIVAAPDPAVAWFAVLADLRLPGAGAFAFTRATGTGTTGIATGTAANSGSSQADVALVRALSAAPGHEVLHFVPLYHPSADRAALAAALRAAADPATAPAAPRASLLVGALTQSLRTADRRALLPALATALEARRADPPAAERLRAWQRELDSLYLPALAPWLALERLDRGRLLVIPSIGAEGRLFSGTADRADNLVAVGSFDGVADAAAPLHAFVREICFPAVSRATNGARGFTVGDPESARRASIAAVRCGAALLDARLPARADAYRAFWLAQAPRNSTASSASDSTANPARRPAAIREAFDRAFPPDAALVSSLDRAIARLARSR